MKLATGILAAACGLAWLSDASADNRRAAIATAHHLATDAGFEVLAAGGNAFDAAVAVSATLAVVEPFSSGIGGGGFWLLHRVEDNHTIMLDGREMAPASASRDMYLDEHGEFVPARAVSGPLSAGIPGEPAALAYLAENYGRLPLSASLAPAIRLAEDGFEVDERYVQELHLLNVLRMNEEARRLFARDGRTPPVGHRVVQKDLAKTLRALAEDGRDGFYRGEVARLLVEGVNAAGGNWTAEDLDGYRLAVREPIVFDYGPHRITTAPPPSSGGVAMATMLNVLEGYDLDRLDEAAQTHLITEAMRRAYRDRSIYLGDPDFVDVPVAMLSDDAYAAGLRAGIRLDRATPSDSLPGIATQAELTDTTHFSLIDDAGNRVAGTLSINLPFGSGLVPPGTGVLLNDEMDDFSARAGSPNAYGLIGADANAIAPGKRPLSSMTPSFVESGDRVAVLGSLGGSRIITTVLLGILEFVDGGDPQDWVSRPRIHHQYVPDRLSIEPGALGEDVIRALEARGHEVQEDNDTWGNMNAVLWNRATGEMKAASDPRNPSGEGRVR